jgi:hypothetical protein
MKVGGVLGEPEGVVVGREVYGGVVGPTVGVTVGLVEGVLVGSVEG